MKRADDGLPVLGASRRTLGAKRHHDIPILADGSVTPGTGGMSVSPNSPMNLPEHRRPPEFGGTGPDPVFMIEDVELGGDLRFVPDRASPDTHGFVEPAYPMTFEQYQRALWATRPSWTRVITP